MSASSALLPYGRQTIEQDDIDAVVAALRDDYLTTGPRVARFEATLARAVNAEHAVACANGTAALHLAVLALGIGPGDVVVVPTITFLASANAVRLAGAEVAFADVDPETGQMTVESCCAAMDRAGQRVAAVMAVHLGGHVGALEDIAALARDCGARAIEDACHALGTTFGGDGTAHAVGDGAHGDCAAFSFHPVKTATTAEGGAVTCRDPALADALRRLRNHGMTRAPADFADREAAFAPSGAPNSWYYEMDRVGLNYRLSDLHCALGLSQLAKLPRFIEARRALAARYDQRLAGLNGVSAVPGRPDSRPCLHLYSVLIDFAGLNRDRAKVMTALRDRGIGTQVHYRPVHAQPYYRARYPGQELSGAERYYARQLSLPLFPGMEAGDVDRVVDALEEVLR